MAFGPSVRIIRETGNPKDLRVIEPVSGNRIPNIRKVTWTHEPGCMPIATIELYATLDVRAYGDQMTPETLAAKVEELARQFT